MHPRSSKASDPWAALTAALLKKEERRPPGEGWLTFRELKNKIGIGECMLRKRLRNNLNSMDVFEGNVEQDGKLVRAKWYRPKNVKA